jgi:hypothetical protein
MAPVDLCVLLLDFKFFFSLHGSAFSSAHDPIFTVHRDHQKSPFHNGVKRSSEADYSQIIPEVLGHFFRRASIFFAFRAFFADSFWFVSAGSAGNVSAPTRKSPHQMLPRVVSMSIMTTIKWQWMPWTASTLTLTTSTRKRSKKLSMKLQRYFCGRHLPDKFIFPRLTLSCFFFFFPKDGGVGCNISQEISCQF